jgi:hypothetical protein
MAAHQVGADVREGTLHGGEQVADNAPAGSGWNKHDCQEPAWSSAADRHVVRVRDHRQQPDLFARECDRIRRHDQDAAGDLERACILTDPSAEQKLGRWSWQVSK